MSNAQTDLVIQISASPVTSGADKATAEQREWIAEIQKMLKPGTEIALVLRGLMAVTSILWLSECQADHCFRAGVRLLRISPLPDSERWLPESSRKSNQADSDRVPLDPRFTLQV